MSRSELREIIIKTLYQIYIYQDKNLSFDLSAIIKEQLEKKNDFVFDTLENILKYQKDISDLANKHMKDWNIDRISKVDKAILSLAIYELLYTDTPDVVAINEAIELSKKYSDEDVTKMINACLDKIYHEELKEEK